MADLPISGLPSAGVLSGTEPLAIVQSGATKQTTVQDVADIALADQTFIKDANNNVFYNGVEAGITAGGILNNIFYQLCGNIIVGSSVTANVFEIGVSNITFGDSLKNVRIKSGDYEQSGPTPLDLTATPTFDFIYNKDYPAEIFLGDDGNPYHQYYDGANDRYVVTLLISPYTVSYIGSSGSGLDLEVNGTPNGDQTLLNLIEGTNIDIADNGTGGVTISSLADRYKTTSNSNILIGNGSRTFTVDANLAYIPLQEVLIVYDASNHMHGTVTSYSGTTLVVDVKNHTGGGTYASWVINLDGIPVDAITGSGTVNRLAYFTAAQVIDDAAAITAARALISDANGIPTHSATTSIELGYVSGVTSAIQTQLNGKRTSANSFRRPTTSDSLNSTDLATINSGSGLTIEMDVTSTANTLTIPLHSSVAFPIGTEINVVQRGTGQTTIAGPGVTLNSSGNWLKLASRYSACTLLKIDTNEWYVFGQLAP